MYDLKRTFASTVLEKPVSSGNSIAKEGLLVVQDMVGGVEYVKMSAGGGDARLVGFSQVDTESPDTEPVATDLLTVPAAGLTACTVTLANVNIVGVDASSTSVRVYSTAASSDLTFEAYNGTPSAAGKFQMVHATGSLLLHVGKAGTTIRVWYRRNLTVAEARAKYYQRSINNTASATLQQCSVLTGSGEIFTYEYDTTSAWAAGGTCKTAANGLITLGAGGLDISSLVQIIHTPTATDPTLGLSFSLKP